MSFRPKTYIRRTLRQKLVQRQCCYVLQHELDTPNWVEMICRISLCDLITASIKRIVQTQCMFNMDLNYLKQFVYAFRLNCHQNTCKAKLQDVASSRNSSLFAIKRSSFCNFKSQAQPTNLITYKIIQFQLKTFHRKEYNHQTGSKHV